MVAPEAFPLLKVGGLADAAGALPKALRSLGVEATVLIPWTPGVEARRVGEVAFSFAGEEERAGLGERVEGGVRFWLLGLPDFARERLYGYPDDVRRFIRFALAGRSLAWGFDLLHLHDWPAALLALYGFPTVYTIHNLAHQGLLDPGAFFHWTGLGWNLFHMEALEFYGKVNLMKGGIVFATRVTAVSPSYMEEIQTPEFGEGLDGVLRKHRPKLRGILNGLDTLYWDPKADPHLPFPYGDWAGKARMEAHLAEALGLKPPVLGVVGRLVHQKGLDLVLEALPHLLWMGYSLVVLGSGEEILEEGFSRAMRAHPGRVHFQGGYDEALAHRIYAGSHAFLMPSRFEPCGLSQMIAMRYGTPPVARRVGGLKDTIRDGRTGVLFDSAHLEGLLSGLCRLERLDREALGRRGMAEEFSWEKPARAYLEVYREVCG